MPDSRCQTAIHHLFTSRDFDNMKTKVPTPMPKALSFAKVWERLIVCNLPLAYMQLYYCAMAHPHSGIIILKSIKKIEE